ncbi:tetratricopeptide repeat protein [Bosea sp. UC22_33]|uniref:tetratricopeptide repeat protein n=1 Tax=Bosea sp. UC22_33 TaxID=3350165 RepID=UPI00367052D7
MPIDGVEESEITSALDSLLNAHSARISERGARFLRYVVEKTLAGEGAQLKAYTIAVDVFGRGVDFDPAKDAVVRNEATRLRAALALYYAVDGAAENVAIRLPVGGYVPRFERRQAKATGTSDSNETLVRAGLQPMPAPAQPEEGRRGPEHKIPIIVVRSAAGEGTREASSRTIRSVVAALVPYHGLRIAGLEPHKSFEELVASLRASGAGSIYVLDIAADVEERTLRCQWILSEHRSGLILASREEIESAGTSSMMAVEKAVGEAVARAIGQRWGIINVNERKLHPDKHRDAYCCVVHAVTYLANLDDAEQKDIRTCLEAAVRDEPLYSDAWAMLSYIQMNEIRGLYARPAESGRILQEALGMADEAIRIAPHSALAHSMRSTVLFAMGKFEEFEKAGRRAIDLNPGSGEHQLTLGNRLYVMGRYEEGAELVRCANAREYYHPAMSYGVPILELYRQRDYEGALRLASNLSIDERYYFMHVILAAVCGQLGAAARAETHLQILRRLRPDYAAEFYVDWRGRKFREDYIAHIAEGLGKVGFAVTGARIDS